MKAQFGAINDLTHRISIRALLAAIFNRSFCLANRLNPVSTSENPAANNGNAMNVPISAL
jgi:hypothetical protein